MPSRPKPSDKATMLAQAAIDHALSSVSEGGPLVPFVFELKGAEFMAHRCLCEEPDGTWDVGKSVEEAKALGRELVESCDAVAIAYDGYMTTRQGEKVDSLFADVIERGTPWVFTFGQLYDPAESPEGFARVNEPSWPGSTRSDNPGSACYRNRSRRFSGVSSRALLRFTRRWPAAR